MNHYGTLRDFRFSDKDIDDIRDANVYGTNDDKLGDIDDVIFDHATGDIRYVVVDTGGWLSSKKFIVPADRLEPSTKHEDDYHVNLTQQQIESFPPYDENSVTDRDRWNDYETRYNSGWTDGPVMHRGDSPDRNITPRPDEMASATGGVRNTTSARTHLGQRWSNFENRLRSDRTRVIGACGVCGIGPRAATTRDRDRKVG
jgi:sporulation protein YlmC with PRC-barrel domain